MVQISNPTRKRTKHYFREWRQFRGLKQEQAMGLLGWSQSKISRIETGKTPYNQDDLENAATAYNCLPTDLVSVDPLIGSDVLDLRNIINELSENEQKKASGVLKLLFGNKQTSTDG